MLLGLPLLNLVFTAAAAAGAMVLARLMSTIVHRLWRAGYDAERSLAILLSLFRFLLLFAVGAIAVRMLMPLFEQLSASAGIVVGVGILLAAYPVLQNIVIGLYLVARGDLREGDRVKLEATTGMVRELGLVRVRLRAEDGTTTLLPNRMLLNRPISVHRASGQARVSVQLDDRQYTNADLPLLRRLAHLCPYRVVATPVTLRLNEGTVEIEIQTWRPRCHEEITDYLKAALASTQPHVA